jgi:Ca2+-binding RTX toxin-like protein
MTITRISVDSAGNQAIGGSRYPSISGDGRFVAFASPAANLVPGDNNNSQDIFVRDLSTNTTTRISVGSAGNQAIGNSFVPSISANGRLVAFGSNASNGVINTPSNNINGTPANDNLTGTPGNDTINGLEGNDALTGLRGNDILNGGGGNDNFMPSLDPPKSPLRRGTLTALLSPPS